MSLGHAQLARYLRGRSVLWQTVRGIPYGLWPWSYRQTLRWPCGLHILMIMWDQQYASRQQNRARLMGCLRFQIHGHVTQCWRSVLTGSEEKGSHTGISQNFRQLGSTSSKGNNALQLVTVPGLQAGAHAQALQMLGCEQSPPACVASTLPAEPLPQPATFNKNIPLLQVRFFYHFWN